MAAPDGEGIRSPGAMGAVGREDFQFASFLELCGVAGMMKVPRILTLLLGAILSYPSILCSQLPRHTQLVPENVGTMLVIQPGQLMEKVDYRLLVFKPLLYSKYSVLQGFDYNDPIERKRVQWLQDFVQRPGEMSGLDPAQPVYVCKMGAQYNEYRVLAAIKDVTVFEEFVRRAVDFKRKEKPEWEDTDGGNRYLRYRKGMDVAHDGKSAVLRVLLFHTDAKEVPNVDPWFKLPENPRQGMAGFLRE